MTINLDESQLKAVYIQNRNVLVVAAPGSGKTTVIINRVNHLVEDIKINIGNIIVITFTRAAADNMRNRYKKRFKKEKAPFFGTFHGLFYKILLREGFEINIIPAGRGHNIVKGVLNKYFDDVNEDKVREVLNNISLYKTSMRRDEFTPSISRDIFNECLESYEAYKKKENFWDFDDLALKVISMLKQDNGILEKYRSIFKYILVDEFQDCDELQIDFLKIINKGNSMFAVGDEDQCIYSFRGSRPQYMVDFEKSFKESKKIYLSINYRSKKNIVEVSKNLIKNNVNRNNKVIKYNDQNEGIINYSKPQNEYMQGMEIANRIKSGVNLEFRDYAVLYRTNMEARSIIDAFTREKIPFVLLDKGYNFFNHFIAKDIINYLKLSIGSDEKQSFISVINKPFRYISKANIAYVNNNRDDLSPFDMLINKDDTPPFQCKKLEELKKDIAYLNKISLPSAIQYIISSLGYIDYLREYSSKYGQNFNDLEDILEEFKGAAEGFRTILDFLIHVKNVEDEIEKSKNECDGVILSTIHGVKGMEFKSVFIINCTEENIPHKSSVEENLEEERRLFYVGVTRAINNLYISSPLNIRGKFLEQSRFVAEGGFVEESNKEKYGINEGTSIYHKTYGEGKVETIKDDRINIDFSDGINRSFSIKVLMENNLMIVLK